TIIGPPTNLAIHPSGEIALIANSMNPEPEGTGWKNVPDDKIFVIDLKASPPKVIATVNAGKQPSGMAINAKGDMALVCNRADGNVDTASVIDLEANPARVIDHVVVGDAPEGFAISPKGDLAVAILLQGSNADKKAFYYHPGGAVVALKIDGKKVTKVGEVQI